MDITLLSKGPEAIPRSGILLCMSIALWLFALLATMSLLTNFGTQDVWTSIGNAILGVFCYTVLLAGMGYLHRAVQTMAALIGVGGLINLFVLAELTLLSPLFGPAVTGLIAQVTIMWSIPVKGHIIARAINWPWYAGIVVALIIFLLQLAFAQSMSPEN